MYIVLFLSYIFIPTHTYPSYCPPKNRLYVCIKMKVMHAFSEGGTPWTWRGQAISHISSPRASRFRRGWLKLHGSPEYLLQFYVIE